MSYKTVLVHVDESRHAEQRIRIAAAIADKQDAHLVGGATTGVSPYIYRSGAAVQAGTDTPLGYHLSALRDRARVALDKFETMARSLDASSYESALLDDEAGAGISLRGRYSDLVVIGQFDPEERSPVVMSDFPEYVLMNAGRPVLMIPYVGRYDTVGRRVLVAWDGGISAARAVTQAIPMLRQAEIVELVVYNAEPDGKPGRAAHGEVPGADIALFLARHGIKVDVIQQQTRANVGDALLSLATDLGSDLLVMGGYGHPRFQEILLGGVTRTVITSMTLPVLMAN
ncbi:MAG TPA: universal stress protein [Noviherbaspirillum sp.]